MDAEEKEKDCSPCRRVRRFSFILDELLILFKQLQTVSQLWRTSRCVNTQDVYSSHSPAVLTEGHPPIHAHW